MEIFSTKELGFIEKMLTLSEKKRLIKEIIKGWKKDLNERDPSIFIGAKIILDFLEESTLLDKKFGISEMLRLLNSPFSILAKTRISSCLTKTLKCYLGNFTKNTNFCYAGVGEIYTELYINKASLNFFYSIKLREGSYLQLYNKLYIKNLGR